MFVLLTFCVVFNAQIVFGDLSNDTTTDKIFIVKLKQSKLATTQSTLSQFSTKLKATVGSELIDTIQIGSFEAAVIKATDDAVVKLNIESEVDYIETNHKITAFYEKCSEYNVDRVWHLERINQREKLWSAGNGTYSMSDTDDGSGVDIFIFDTGIKIDHHDFDNRAQHSFKPLGMDEGWGDYEGHGTHVAGTAGGKTYGVAKNASILNVKVLDMNGNGYAHWLLAGIEHVTNKFDKMKAEKGMTPKFICSMSLGFNGILNAVDNAISEAIAMGIHFVVAAGNEAVDTCGVSPARVPEAVTVTASDSEDTLAEFSNYGTCVDIIAPGVKILSAGIGWSGEETLDGTSMATPVVTGIMARLLSIMDSEYGLNPDPKVLKQHLLNLTTRNAISLTGNGNPDFAQDTPNKLAYVECVKNVGKVPIFTTTTERNPCLKYPRPNYCPWTGTATFKKLDMVIVLLLSMVYA